MKRLFSKAIIFFTASLLFNNSCAVNRRQSVLPAPRSIEVGMKISEVEEIVKKAGGKETYLDMMSKPGSNIIVRSYWLNENTVISLGVLNNTVVEDILICTNADQAKAYRHWESVKKVALP